MSFSAHRSGSVEGLVGRPPRSTRPKPPARFPTAVARISSFDRLIIRLASLGPARN